MITAHQHIVFETENAKILQDDGSNKFELVLGASSYLLDRFAFATLKRKVKSIDLAELICNTDVSTEIIHLPENDHFIVLDIRQVIELKELITGACAMMTLNSHIHKEIKRKSLLS
ncbi:MAG: hypothetical protein JXR10_10385 [Cyclobacteriaceae bacterium]